MHYKSRFLVYSLFALVVTSAGCKNEEIVDTSKQKIILQATLTDTDFSSGKVNNDLLHLEYRSINRVDHTAWWTKAKGKVIDRQIRWEIYSDDPVQIISNITIMGMASPGDSINILRSSDAFIFSGQGSEKFNLLNQINQVKSSLTKPSKSAFDVKDSRDYLRWDKYVDDKLNLQMRVLESMADRLSPAEFNYLKASIVSSAELERINAFEALHIANMNSPITASLNAIWDSTQYRKWGVWLRSLAEYRGSLLSIYAFAKMEVRRKFDFDAARDSINKKELRTLKYYTNARDNYQGLLRERLMTFILNEQVITEMGKNNPMTQLILKDYYSQPGFAEHKQWIREVEAKAK